jgi:hypothetical protein
MNERMKGMQWISPGWAQASRGILCWAVVASLSVAVSEDEDLIRIDFRNKIPGVIDAPVFDFDGVSGLEARHGVLLTASVEGPHSLVPVGSAQQFLTGADAGYWQYEEPMEIILFPQPDWGQRVWYELTIFEQIPVIGPYAPSVVAGRSDVYSMVVTNRVMPLVGLESFSLVPERLRIRQTDDQVVIEWEYLAARRYELQRTDRLRPGAVWSTVFEWEGFPEGGYSLFSVTNALTTAPRFYRLERWRWVQR